MMTQGFRQLTTVADFLTLIFCPLKVGLAQAGLVQSSVDLVNKTNRKRLTREDTAWSNDLAYNCKLLTEKTAIRLKYDVNKTSNLELLQKMPEGGWSAVIAV